MTAKHALMAGLYLAAFCNAMAQTECSFRDYDIPLPFAGCGQVGPHSLTGCPFCVLAYDQNTPLLSCGPAIDEIGDPIPCGEEMKEEHNRDTV
ncbi:hypothetical protein WJX77_004651 [Trebouxia sp. C0004]